MHCRDIPQAWSAAVTANDMGAFADLFEPDARFVNVLGSLWKGRAQIEAEHAALGGTVFRDVRLEMLSVESFPLAPGCEAIHAHWRLTRRPGAGGVGDPPRQGVLLMVARGAGDDWKIALVQNTNLALVPPSA